ncbi:hypothetical protein [Halobacillus hunanensis]|uniref:hypothetical protein n=1 Tax=Halobacillus hunanensis TaxID=578214 RepID=UPI0009A7712B|nr:hypothetical protein [Halobacillus hunanensis]
MLQYYRDEQLLLWTKLLHELFPNGVPNKADWDKKEDIMKVLKFVGEHKASNHTFLPESGGLDLVGADLATEEETIELLFDGNPQILKPKVLHFRWNQEADSEWAYFYLEAGELPDSKVYSNSSNHEELAELDPGEYVDRGCWEKGEIGGQKIPRSARLIKRHRSGSFVIFSKGSKYNAVTGTYDGRHDKFGFKNFEKYISGTIEAINDEVRHTLT